MLAERPWFETDEMEAHLSAVGADSETTEFARALNRDGVAVIDLGVAGRLLCDDVATQAEAVFEKRKAERIQDLWLRSSETRALANHPKVLKLLETVYGRKPFAFQTLNFRRGTQQDIHSDAVHFHSAPERFMCGVWIALEDISPNAGPLTYHPGSHRLPVLTMRGAGVNHDAPKYEDYQRTYIPALRDRLAHANLPTTTAVLKKGQALVWAANLAHGGAPVIDPASSRKSLVVHFYFEGCMYYTPMTSVEEEGRYTVRLPANVRTGGVEWPRRGGRAVPVKLKFIAEALRKIVLRHVHT